MKKFNVLIDSNVYISGTFWKGASSKILELWKKGRIINISSLPIIYETINVLRYFKINLTEELIYSHYTFLVENSIIIDDSKIINFPVRDCKDNKILKCALLGKVDFIVTFDKDLLDIKEYSNIKIIKPIKLLSILSDNV